MFKFIKQYIKFSKVNKIFWDEISTNTELINFFSKNLFTHHQGKYDDLIFSKISIIDNTLNLYADKDDIEGEIRNQYETKLQELFNYSNFNLENNYTLNLELEKYKLLEYSTTFFNDDKNIYNKPKIINQIKSNLIENNLVSDALDVNEVWVYKLTFQYKNKDIIIKLKKKIKKYIYFSLFFIAMITIICFLIWIK